MVTSARPLTVEEERVRGNVFDIDLLAGRLLDVTAGLQAMPDVLAAYRLLRSEHRCRGRPDRRGRFGRRHRRHRLLRRPAGSRGRELVLVRALTLLIDGGYDDTCSELNRAAQAWLHCPNRLETLPDATDLFEGPGALDAVAPALPADGSPTTPTRSRHRADFLADWRAPGWSVSPPHGPGRVIAT